MNRHHLTSVAIAFVLLGSCVTKKKYAELDEKNKMIRQDLAQNTAKLIACDQEKTDALAKIGSLQEQLESLRASNKDMYNINRDLINNIGNLTTLTQKGAENLEKSLESIKEKDTRIQRLQDAMTKKDSVTLALVTSLKGSLGNLNDPDIEVNVEKGVVYISIADKLLFKSGSYTVSDKAKTVLGKVATVVKSKPDFEVMVEGHTDNVPVVKSAEMVDNWDLSTKRATAVIRILQGEFNVAPERMVAAGRGEYVPLADNGTADGKSKNRRTRILVLPKIDQFYKMIEEGMKQAPK
jgi:chemotaxis protein MotB